ncbi:DNA repair protein RAD51 homolog 4-like isoform X2 [Crassostrea virginica]
MALLQFTAFPVNCAEFFQTTLTSSSIIPTPAENLNNLLDGGLYTSEITEIAGEISAGKTQFCLSLCVSVAMKAHQNVLYIDTCGSFSADRLAEIAASQYGEECSEDVLKAVKVVEAFDIFQLMTVLQNIKEDFISQTDPFYDDLKVLIVDSVSAVIYPSLGGQQMDGHGLMVQLSLNLKRLAASYSLSVLVINNVLGDGKVSLGKTWSHVPHCRLLISHPKDDKPSIRELVLVKSSRLATGGKSRVEITEKGLQDVT